MNFTLLILFLIFKNFFKQMKNFKFFSVAVVALALGFSACSKDESFKQEDVGGVKAAVVIDDGIVKKTVFTPTEFESQGLPGEKKLEVSLGDIVLSDKIDGINIRILTNLGNMRVVFMNPPTPGTFTIFSAGTELAKWEFDTEKCYNGAECLPSTNNFPLPAGTSIVWYSPTSSFEAPEVQQEFTVSILKVGGNDIFEYGSFEVFTFPEFEEIGLDVLNFPAFPTIKPSGFWLVYENGGQVPYQPGDTKVLTSNILMTPGFDIIPKVTILKVGGNETFVYGYFEEFTFPEFEEIGLDVLNFPAFPSIKPSGFWLVYENGGQVPYKPGDKKLLTTDILMTPGFDILPKVSILKVGGNETFVYGYFEEFTFPEFEEIGLDVLNFPAFPNIEPSGFWLVYENGGQVPYKPGDKKVLTSDILMTPDYKLIEVGPTVPTKEELDALAADILKAVQDAFAKDGKAIVVTGSTKNSTAIILNIEGVEYIFEGGNNFTADKKLEILGKTFIITIKESGKDKTVSFAVTYV